MSLVAWFEEITEKASFINWDGERNLGMHNRAFERIIISTFYLLMIFG